MKQIFREIYDLARPFLNTRRNDIHTEIALGYAMILLETEKGDPDVVVPAVILHDLGWWSVSEDLHLKAFGPHNPDRNLNRIHEIEGVRMAGEILARVSYDKSKEEEILNIIDGHDSRLEAVSTNDMIVKDADKLWRISPRGFAIDADRFGVCPGDYLVWLEKCVGKWFFTETARQIALKELSILEKAMSDRREVNK